MIYALGIAAGSMLSVQTAINAKLRGYVKTPFLSAMFSCLTSFLIILVMLLAGSGTGLISRDTFTGASWWMFAGGFLGSFVLVGCIALFPILGAVQTTVLPIFGQILLGILADAFGWFGYEKKLLSPMGALGTAVLVIGIIFAVVLPNRDPAAHGSGEAPVKNRLLWQIVGILAGMASAAQAAVNGRLGVVTGSPLLASCISVMTVVAIVALINLKQGNFGNLRHLKEEKPVWWSFTGGILGVGVVFLSAFAAPKIGTGMLMIFSVTGQLVFSMLIQQFGWLGSVQKKIGLVQGIGLVLILVGVVMAKMM